MGMVGIVIQPPPGNHGFLTTARAKVLFGLMARRSMEAFKEEIKPSLCQRLRLAFTFSPFWVRGCWPAHSWCGSFAELGPRGSSAVASPAPLLCV